LLLSRNAVSKSKALCPSHYFMHKRKPRADA